MEQIRWIVALVFLGAQSIRDLRTKTINIPISVAAIIAGVVFGFLEPAYTVRACIAGIVPGIVLCFLAFVTREAVGYGDGLVLTGMGLLLGVRYCFAAGMTAVMLAGVFSFFLILIRHAGRKDEVAFVPFLFLGAVIVKGALYI